jgi:transmembrane serine protease 4
MTLNHSINASNIRIINGKDATTEEFPWVSSIIAKNRGYCGGVIIDKHWILSAAHCFYP